MRVCPECEAEVFGPASKRYCTERCRKRAENRRTHSRNQGNLHVTVSCTYCGEDCIKAKRALRPNRFCSLICRDLWSIETRPAWKPPSPSLRVCALPKDHPARWVGTYTDVVYGHCPECEVLHCSPAHSPRTYCSRPCRATAKWRRAQPTKRVRKVRIRTARRLAVYERDVAVPHPDAPTLDHLVPVIDGGTDDPANLGTAHFLCNSKRGRRLNLAA